MWTVVRYQHPPEGFGPVQRRWAALSELLVQQTFLKYVDERGGKLIGGPHEGLVLQRLTASRIP